ncbi:hypothetical protein FM076_16390 [Streptomyces albus subsp. chlorinus]|uniref:hypothetical protein n=1 Tax=Streptomyces albus TaxID=1888 RepID=UPI00156E281F|nr:hypothetical protein [Streptomyces albus]NSC22665.1 hypothetical protein [Streptomyces albus subsp. chlorinus]
MTKIPLVRACGGIFSKQETKEIRHSYVHSRKREGYRKTAEYLRRPSSHSSEPGKVLCDLTTAKNPVSGDLLNIRATWDSIGPKNGKPVEWRPSLEGGRAAGQIAVTCLNPGEKKIRTEFEAVKLYMYDHVNLSDNSRARLLLNAAKKLIPLMDCQNNITYPDPDMVAPR